MSLRIFNMEDELIENFFNPNPKNNGTKAGLAASPHTALYTSLFSCTYCWCNKFKNCRMKGCIYISYIWLPLSAASVYWTRSLVRLKRIHMLCKAICQYRCRRNYHYAHRQLLPVWPCCRQFFSRLFKKYLAFSARQGGYHRKHNF